MTMLSDAHLRKAIIGAVSFVICACILSQIMMQMGGGPRDEGIDISDQLDMSPVDLCEGDACLIFEDGLPPFISSAGAFYPERAIFDAAIGIGGLMMIAFSFEAFHRTKPESEVRKIANVCGLISGVGIGFSMFNIIVYPFNTELLLHIFYALVVFWGALFWAICMTVARKELDRGITWKNWEINQIRTTLCSVIIFSFILMSILVNIGEFVAAAIFEWMLMFASQGFLLTFIPILEITDAQQSSN
ncbi:MAG: hypothetical protein VX627_05900 [Candidatus Thermoplasmatota archaeon]|nr:hypothetical protein [Candidatus Thermoplasmatota archaeon]